MRFKIGDRVRRQGGYNWQVMLVVDYHVLNAEELFNRYGYNGPPGADVYDIHEVVCSWWEAGQIKEKIFDVTQLEKS